MIILMIASGFELGGVTSAMRNLCNELVARGHCVDLLNLPGAAELPEDFDKRINVIHLTGFARNWNLGMTAVRDASGFRKLWLLLLGAFKKATNQGTLWHRIVFHGLKITKHYDISIGFRQSPVSYWLAKYKCDSDLSVGFWHTDADFENVTQLEGCLHYPDKICCVSDAITSQMKQKYPELRDKFTTVYNLFDTASIRKAADESIPDYDMVTPFLLTIGNNVTITNCRLLTHDASTKKFLGYTKAGKIVIGNNVFIGANAVVLPNTHIGDRVIIGAGAVVAHDMPDNSVVVGNPCRVICTCDEYIAKQQARMGNYPVFDFWGSELNSVQRTKERELLSNVGEGYFR